MSGVTGAGTFFTRMFVTPSLSALSHLAYRSKLPAWLWGSAVTVLVADTGAWNSGVFAGLSSQRPRVRIPSLPLAAGGFKHRQAFPLEPFGCLHRVYSFPIVALLIGACGSDPAPPLPVRAWRTLTLRRRLPLASPTGHRLLITCYQSRDVVVSACRLRELPVREHRPRFRSYNPGLGFVRGCAAW